MNIKLLIFFGIIACFCASNGLFIVLVLNFLALLIWNFFMLIAFLIVFSVLERVNKIVLNKPKLFCYIVMLSTSLFVLGVYYNQSILNKSLDVKFVVLGLFLQVLVLLLMAIYSNKVINKNFSLPIKIKVKK